MSKAKRKKPEKALICAENLITDEHVLLQYRLTRAIVAFMPLHGMDEAFCGNKGCQVPANHYWNTWVRDDGTALVGPVFGGPLCAVIVEELAACGVKSFIGCGYSGTLDASVPPCSIVVADAALNSDGTTREYTRRRDIPADADMLGLLREAIARRGLPDISGKVWTTDAIYREYPSKVAYWKGKGARFVNMDTSPLYAVAKEKGLKAAYLSVVSDNVSGEDWSGWYPDHAEPVRQMHEICLEVISKL